MTNEELFIHSIKKIKEQMIEERADIKRSDPLNSQIAAEYDDCIVRLSRIIPEITDIDSVFELDEEDYIFVLDCLDVYCENFIIDGTDKTALKKGEEEFSQLQDILFEFYDDEDEEDDDEDDEDSDDENDDSGDDE